MAKRRNKNKKAGPVKIIRPADLNPQAVEMAASEPETGEESSTTTVADEGAQVAEATGGPAPFEWSEADAEAATEAATDDAEPAVAGDELAGSAESPESVEPGQAADGDSSDSSDSAPDPLPEFEDASALPAQSLPAQSQEDPAVLTSGSGLDESMPGTDDASATTPAKAAPAVEPQPDMGSGRGGKNRKDRKLKLNKQQKQARGDLEPPAPHVAVSPQAESAGEPEAGLWVEPQAQHGAEPEAESHAAPIAEAEPVAETGPVVAEAPAEPQRQGPSEPRIAAFAKLSEYQTLSLAHVAGIPEEADLPGHWRGVGFAISGRRLVTAFDEVVEIIRVPQITHVPGTQAWMLGVANVRGTLLPVVDLKQFLEGERTVMYEGQRVMVVRQSGGNVAVLIDQLYGQRAFNDSQKIEVVADGSTRYGHFIKQLYRVGDNDWGVFSMSMLTRTPEFRQAAA